jgi:hypothetical protein
LFLCRKREYWPDSRGLLLCPHIFLQT